MKKLFSIFALVALLSCAVFAEDTSLTPQKDPSKWSDMTYVNIPVLKVLESRDGYLVIYQKNKIGVGSTVIPKAWVHGTPENPKKLVMRKTNYDKYASLTVVKKSDEFHRVILTLPTSKSSSIWGVFDKTQKLEGTDKETLEELDLF